MTNKNINAEIRKLLDKSIVAGEVKSKEFVDTRTGETKTQFNIMDIGHMEELNPKPKPKRLKKNASFSDRIQHQIDKMNSGF